MDTIGEIVELIGKNAKVKFVRSKACKNCGACISFSDTELVVELDNTLDAKVGDRVTISLHSKNIVKASLIMYGIPLVALILGALAGSLIGDLYTAVFGIAAALLAYFVLHLFEPRFERSGEFNPRMVDFAKDDDNVEPDK